MRSTDSRELSAGELPIAWPLLALSSGASPDRCPSSSPCASRVALQLMTRCDRAASLSRTFPFRLLHNW